METKKNIKQIVLDELDNTNFPKCNTRTNVAGDKSVLAFSLGQVNYRGQKFLGGKTKGPSRFNKKFPALLKKLRKMMRLWHPTFKYTTIQVNKNFSSKPHVDKNNVGLSYVIAMGDYTGGEIYVEGKEHNINNKFLKFNGTLGHWVAPYKGERYSLVFFTHTFKPPNPTTRHLNVTKHGLYNKNTLIKKYSPDGPVDESDYSDSSDSD